MKCKDAKEMINSYIDNKIDPMEDKLLAEHIASCPECRAELEFLLKYRNIIKTVKPVSPPDNFLSELHRKIEIERDESLVKKIIEPIGSFFNILNFPLEAAGVLAVAVVVFFLYKPYYSEKIQSTTSEYTIESPREETPISKKIPENSGKSDKEVTVKNIQPVIKESPSGIKRLKTEVAEYKSSDDNFLLKPETESSGESERKKSYSAETKRSLVEEKEKPYQTESIDSDNILSEKKDSDEGSDSDPDILLRKFNASIIKKDLTAGGRIYYRIKINPSDYPLLLKKLKMEYLVTEKILTKSELSYEIELFLSKNKK